MRKNKALVLKKILLSAGVFVISVAATLLLGGALLRNTQLETKVAKNFFAEIDEFDQIDRQVKFTQEINISEDLAITKENQPDSEEEKKDIEDENKTDTTEATYTPEQLRDFLLGQEFPFQVFNALESDPEEFKNSEQYFDNLISKLEKTEAPKPLEKDVKNLIEGSKGYKDLFVEYTDVFNYLLALNEGFTQHIEAPATNSLEIEELITKVEEINSPKVCEEYQEAFLEDLSLVKDSIAESDSLENEEDDSITSSSSEAQSPQESQEVQVEELVEDSKVLESTEEAQPTVSAAEVRLDLQSTTKSYNVLSFFEEDDQKKLEDSLNLMQDSWENIKEYREVNLEDSKAKP